MTAIGLRRPRIDGKPKVTGKADYAGDLRLPRMLHARPVLSPYAHARILGVDKPSALRVPGVTHVLTFEDLPLKAGSGRQAEPLARHEVVFAGQPIALVLGVSEAAAADGAATLELDLEALEPVLGLEAAMALDAPLSILEAGESETDVAMHGDAGDTGAAEHEDLSENVVFQGTLAREDAEAALAASAAVAGGRFSVPWVHQAYMEPQVCVAWREGDGVAVRASTQGIFWLRSIISRLFDLPPNLVRVEAATLGGGFGGKLGLIEPLVVAATLAVDAPVKLAFTRSEDMVATNPAPAIEFDVRIGADADGRLTAIAGRLMMDGGAFADSAPTPLLASRMQCVYHFPAAHLRSYGIRTNRVGSGAYRAPTGMQTAFVVETLLDELAEQLDLDPIELRERNLLSYHQVKLDGTEWPHVGLRETLAALREHPLWAGRHELPSDEGVGFACGLFPGGKMGAAAGCRMDSDGGFTLQSGYVDMSGTDTTVTAIAAEILGLAPERVRIVASDSDSAPHAGVSGGSMVTYCLGNAVRAAAEQARDQILMVASDQLEIEVSDLELADGTVRPKGVPARAIPFEDIAAQTTGFGSLPPIEGHARVIPPELSPSAAACLSHVRVDRESGEIEVLEHVAAQDVGTAINPSLCEGQMRGGAAQAIGFALQESLDYDEDGQLLSGSFMSYAVPRVDRIPDVETIIVEVPSPHGPLGARGIGESAIVPGPAAVANAVHAATGVRFRDLPMKPDRVWRALAS